MGVLLIVAVVVIIVILAIGARKKRIYRKYVLPYRSYVYGENRAGSMKGLITTYSYKLAKHSQHQIWFVALKRKGGTANACRW